MPTLPIDDIELYYESYGDGSPLVLLHGLGSSTRDWEQQIDAFARQHRVIALDLRGHGRSSKPPGPYSLAQMAGDVAALLRALEITPAHIAGISMGGMVALQLALDAPASVASLILANTVPAVVPRTLHEHLLLWQRLLVLRFGSMHTIGRFLSRRLFPKPEQETLRREFIRRWRENDKRAYTAAAKAIIGWDVSARLGEIACPVLVLAGDRDYLPVARKAAYAAQLPAAKLVVLADSGHASPVDQPEQFNAAVLRFLQQVEAKDAAGRIAG